MGHVYRDSVTGRFVSREEAQARPRETTRETVDQKRRVGTERAEGEEREETDGAQTGS